VGSYPGREGLYDLAGNVAEWTADFRAPYGLSECWRGVGAMDPLCLDDVGDGRAVRGGSWDEGDANYLRSAFRNAVAEAVQDATVGFRCVRDR
jgi:formylglycine-generating enzyme required for sulfatase activity